MKTFIKKLPLLALVFLISGVAFSQKNKTKTEKANEKFALFNYIDARKIYEGILEDNPQNATAEIYKKLGDTYYLNSEYAQAVDKYKRLKESFPSEMTPIYSFRLSQSLKSQGNFEEAEEILKGVDMRNISTAAIDSNFEQSTKQQTQRFKVSKVSINSPSSDFGTSFYQDKIVYASASSIGEGAKIDDWTGQPFLDLYVAEMDEFGELTSLGAIDGDINTKFHESSAAFTKDGSTVYFTRNNFIDGKKARDKKKTIRLKLYKATKSGDNFWTNIVELPMTSDLGSTINSNDWSTSHPALSIDDKRLYFASDRPGSKALLPTDVNDKKSKRRKEDVLVLSDIWYVDILGDNSYGKPKQVDNINTIFRETFPFVSNEGELYYSSDTPGGEGGLDVYKVTLDSVSGQPTNEVARFNAPVNSNQDDFGFIWDGEKELGYFSSNRDGSEGSVSDDIYLVVEECIITLGGVVVDDQTGLPIPGAEVVLLDAQLAQVGEAMIVGIDGRYSFEVDCCEEYTVRASKEKNIAILECYITNETFIGKTPCDKSSTLDVPLPLKLDPCCGANLGACLCLQPIYFDFDRYNIRPDAEIELNKILNAMIQNPGLIVNIESHTDMRGTHAYNEILSDKRAQSTLEWLVVNGIERSRLSAKGFGENQLLDRCTELDECGQEVPIEGCTLSQFSEGNTKCSDGVKCSEEEHQNNRRSKFLIDSGSQF
jgi:outer membrane protein OmpA-like peptidoglycan-associated protein/tetratricopeptide (TPR) repeat protein